MSTIILGETRLIDFVLTDTDGVEVPGLGSTFSVAISKNGGAFGAGAGVKAEIGSGWYSYVLPASETDTLGPLAIKITGAGAEQQNLLHQIAGSTWAPGSGPYILTTTEAAAVLRCEDDDPNMLMLLPAIDAYVKMATGRDWAADSPIYEEAKSAARMLLVIWHEDPGGIATGGALGWGLQACLAQLKAIAMSYKTFEGMDGAGYIRMPGAHEGDTVESLIGKVGATGDQSASFETVISRHGYIQQLSTLDLSDQWFIAHLLSPEDL